jgi:hypothetical protein
VSPSCNSEDASWLHCFVDEQFDHSYGVVRHLLVLQRGEHRTFNVDANSCQDNKNTVKHKHVSPAHHSVWPDYSRILGFIKKNKLLQVFNGVPTPDSLEDGKIVAIVGKRGTQAHKNKYEICFKYSCFKPMFMKRDFIEHFLVEDDVAPKQSTLPQPEVSIEARGGTTSRCAATRAAAAKRARRTDPGILTLPELPPLTRAKSTVTDNASLTPRRRVGTTRPIRTPTTTPVSCMTDYAIQIKRFLTKVAVNELGDCPGSESDDDEENPSQGFCMNLLVSDDPWTTHAGISEDTVTIKEEDDVAYVEHNLADSEVESHHGLYWKRDGVLEEPQPKMPKTSGQLKP